MSYNLNCFRYHRHKLDAKFENDVKVKIILRIDLDHLWSLISVSDLEVNGTS